MTVNLITLDTRYIVNAKMHRPMSIHEHVVFCRAVFGLFMISNATVSFFLFRLMGLRQAGQLERLGTSLSPEASQFMMQDLQKVWPGSRG